tara:strand:- start:1005 stop:1487 length:483 start_codon:yes stop_codon:yes gene_type:complete
MARKGAPLLTARIVGGEELRKVLNDKDLVRGPLRDFLVSSAELVAGEARKLAPSDRGLLRNSISPEVKDLSAEVVAHAKYGRHVEFGQRPHWPPLSAMQPWARRHGFPAGVVGAFLVARAIAQRGVKPRPFMAPALKTSLPRINRFLKIASAAMGERWAR